MSMNFRELRSVLDSREMTDELSIEHLLFAQETLHWMQGEGWRRLRSEVTLTPQEWEELWRNIWFIKRDFGDGPATYYLYKEVVDRGIHDILAYAKQVHESSGIEGLEKVNRSGKPLREWWLYLIASLDVKGFNMGLKAGNVWSSGVLDRLSSLVPVAQLCQSQNMLEELAMNRSLTCDEEARSIYCQHQKTW